MSGDLLPTRLAMEPTGRGSIVRVYRDDGWRTRVARPDGEAVRMEDLLRVASGRGRAAALPYSARRTPGPDSAKRSVTAGVRRGTGHRGRSTQVLPYRRAYGYGEGK